ncbi:hypothetical protein AVEN_181451-1 [Araneus ventricosus]|uniref:Uncharacterized protein n=1 Tax=Araneus ventricosus TaxID=182803 RepID=A0A4Y2E2N8_ARAVE|nr:hypothetical protein AVEN_181451-1 [Araneus ventricosus]
MDLFIDLKNELAVFRNYIYSKVDSFSKMICPTDVTIQNKDPRPSLQREIIKNELKSETSTYASVAQTSSAIPEGKFKVLGPQNVRGLRTKPLSSIVPVEYDVICITETWLCEDIDSWYLFDERYLDYRKDRGSSSNSNRRRGDVLVAIKMSFFQ